MPKRVDDNQAEIVDALRRWGVSVQHLHEVGGGCPDLLCGWRGHTFVVEIKDGRKPASKRKLTPAEKKWHAEWNGRQVAIVESVEDALVLLNQFS